MSYRIVSLPRADGDFWSMRAYIAERSARGAEAWSQAYFRAMKALESNPFLHGLAPESKDHPHEIRQVVFRTRRGKPYRALYTVRGSEVFILHVRGPGQDLIAPEDLATPLD